MARTYNFQLPYTISGFMVHFGVDQFKSNGLFEKLPKNLQNRLTDAYNLWADVTITQHDCDEVDDSTWAILASELNLSWSP